MLILTSQLRKWKKLRRRRMRRRRHDCLGSQADLSSPTNTRQSMWRWVELGLSSAAEEYRWAPLWSQRASPASSNSIG